MFCQNGNDLNSVKTTMMSEVLRRRGDAGKQGTFNLPFCESPAVSTRKLIASLVFENLLNSERKRTLEDEGWREVTVRLHNDTRWHSIMRKTLISWDLFKTGLNCLLPLPVNRWNVTGTFCLWLFSWADPQTKAIWQTLRFVVTNYCTLLQPSFYTAKYYKRHLFFCFF